LKKKDYLKANTKIKNKLEENKNEIIEEIEILSKATLARLAGNSIQVQVLEKIFEKILEIVLEIKK